MDRKLVFDLPTRMFHWFIAGLFIMTFTIAKVVDDESALFTYHMLLGFMLVGAVLMRIIWGFIGSRYASFGDFQLKPSSLWRYFENIIKGGDKAEAGHNPASSWSAIIMFLLSLGLGASGYLMVTGYKSEFFEEVHELFANAFIIVVILHILGVILHSLRHKDKILLSMLNGKKAGLQDDAEIKSNHIFAAMVFAFLLAGFGAQLIRGYHSQNRSLTIWGQTLQLGENEKQNEKHNEEMEFEEGDRD